MDTIPKNKGGRPKKQPRMKLDTSMTADEAKDQKLIADSKQSIYKAKLAELKVLEASKQTIDTSLVVSIIQEVFSKLKTTLYSVSNNVPAQIIGKSHTEVSDILYKFIDESLERFITEFDDKLYNMKIKEEDITEDD